MTPMFLRTPLPRRKHDVSSLLLDVLIKVIETKAMGVMNFITFITFSNTIWLSTSASVPLSVLLSRDPSLGSTPSDADDANAQGWYRHTSSRIARRHILITAEEATQGDGHHRSTPLWHLVFCQWKPPPFPC